MLRRKKFFSEKKNQKTFVTKATRVSAFGGQLSKVFLLLFLQKKKFFFYSIFFALTSCVHFEPAAVPEDLSGSTGITYIPMKTLPGWYDDDTASALAVFVKSCRAITLMPPDQALGGAGIPRQAAGQAGDWQNVCTAAEAVNPGDSTAARAYFENYFAAFGINDNALITGYFEPEYLGSKNLSPRFTFPIYETPADPKLANLPRAAIDRNALYRKAPVTAYLSNPVDVFMLQISGAGRIILPDGKTLRVGFDSQNNQPYTPIGSLLVADGDLAANNVSFQSITDWLKSHPREAQGIMEQNARYVYFRPLGDLPNNEGAPGALGVPLTAGRSLAVDAKFIPFGMPVFVASTNPLTQTPLDSLTVAQDTDSGIHGAAQAKLFFGAGPDAEATAGVMKQSGKLFILIPNPSHSP